MAWLAKSVLEGTDVEQIYRQALSDGVPAALIECLRGIRFRPDVRQPVEEGYLLVVAVVILKESLLRQSTSAALPSTPP